MECGSLEDVCRVAAAAGWTPEGVLPEEVLAVVARDSLHALCRLHEASEPIVHRDIKPSNLLVNSHGKVKLADFNTARVVRGSMKSAHTYTGSTHYMAPERIDSSSHTAVSDIWSLGLTLYTLAMGENPYEKLSGTLMDLIREVVEGKPPQLPRDLGPLNVPFSESFRDFLGRCLVQDPEERASAAELAQHPWVLHAPDSDWFSSWLEQAAEDAAEWEEQEDSSPHLLHDPEPMSM